MEWITGLISQYNAAIKVNPILATLMIPVIGGIMYYVKDFPNKVWAFLVRYTTVTMNMNNAGWDGNADAYNAFDKWFMQSGYKKYSRTFFMFRQYKEDLFGGEKYQHFRLGIGKGIHVFFYQGKLYWFQKGALNSSGSEREKEEITIRTFGWNHRVFEKLITLFNEKKTGTKSITMHKYSQGDKGWEEIGEIPVRDLKTFCMNEGIKLDILKKIDFFISRREWYAKKGLTYKTSFMFQGPPGTGKTTLSKLLAMHYRRDLYILDLTQHSNSSLVSALSKVKPGSFVLMEDIDQAGRAVQKREKDKKPNPATDEIAAPSNSLTLELGPDLFGLTMSGVLNAFDGVVSLDNVITLMTTNHPEDLDPAIRRKSRIDNEYEIGLLTGLEIYNYMVLMYDDFDLHPAQDEIRRFLTNSKLTLEGCEVENAFKENPEDPEAFVSDVCQRSGKALRLVA